MRARIYVLGGGAIGSVIAHQLRASGTEVTVLLRHAQQATGSIDLQGPQNLGQQSVQEVELQSSNAKGERIEQLIVTAKAFDIVPAIRQLKPRLAPDSGILLVHNGMLDSAQRDALHRIVSPQNIWGSVWLGGSKLLARLPESRIDWNSPAEWTMGPSTANQTSPSSSLEFLIEATLACTSMQGKQVSFDRLGFVQRSKLAVNAVLNPLTGLMNVENGLMLPHEALERIVRSLCQETAAVFEAESPKGSKLDSSLTAEALTKNVLKVCKLTEKNISSTLTDVRQDRRTEMCACSCDYSCSRGIAHSSQINGWIVKTGKDLGVPTPAHQIIVNLIDLRSALGSKSFAF